MKAFFSNLLVLTFVFSTVAADFARADDGDSPYSAYARPRDRTWNPAWTPGLLAALSSQKGNLEAARDIENYCPGYHQASAAQQNNCFVRLFTGISAWESSNRPGVVADGERSVGLLQIMAPNCKREGFGSSALQNPQANLRCGIDLAARLVKRDGVIAGQKSVRGRWGTTRTVRAGLGRGGWSTMMANRLFRYRGRVVQVGRLSQIASGMKTYRDPRAGTVAVLEKKRKLPA